MDRLLGRMLLGTFSCAGIFCVMVHAADQVSRMPVPTPANQAFRCTKHTCFVPDDGAYPYLIVGRFHAKATPLQTRGVFNAMRARGRWQSLPGRAKAFQAGLQPVAIRLSDGTTLAVLITREEVRLTQPRSGDLVRYSPHRGKYEIPPTDPVKRAWWSVDGCVAILCRKGDGACFKRYRMGVYRLDGMAISPRTGKPLPHHVTIDPDSLLPAAG